MYTTLSRRGSAVPKNYLIFNISPIWGLWNVDHLFDDEPHAFLKCLSFVSSDVAIVNWRWEGASSSPAFSMQSYMK